MAELYRFHVHATAPAWRLVLKEGASPRGYAPAEWRFTRAREAGDVNPDVRMICDETGFCLFKIGASFEALLADIAPPSPP